MTIELLLFPATTAGRRASARPRSATRRTGLASGAIALAPFALAALSGLAYAAGFPPLALGWTAWLALAPLLVVCAALSPLRAALAGMCWTATATLGVASYLPGMLSSYFGLGAAPSWLASLAVAGGLHGIYVSGYCAWVAWLARHRAANPVLLAGGWLACEFARAHGALASPWAQVAYSQLGWAPLIQIADLAGPYGIGMLVAAANAGVAACLAPALRGHRPRRSAIVIAAAMAGALIYGHWRLDQTFDDGPPVHVAVVQGGASTADAAQRPARLARYLELTRSGADAQTDLIVWPEYAVETYLEETSPTRHDVLRLAEDRRVDLVLGGPHYEASRAGTRYHNSVYLVRDGRLAARYDKHRLVPFAEQARLTWLLDAPATSYTPGRGTFVLPAATVRLGALLCLEAMFPELARRAARQGAEVLVNLSNDAWFGDAHAARQQLDIATLRAVETRRYLVRAASTGFSAIIDPHGRTLARSAFDTQQVLNATVRAARARSPYQRWGDAFAWLVIGCVAAATLRRLLDRSMTPQP